MIKYYKLFDVLNRRGLKKINLIELANITAPTVSRISKGRSISTDTINKICAALSVQPADIMEYIPDGAEDQEQEK